MRYINVCVCVCVNVYTSLLTQCAYPTPPSHLPTLPSPPSSRIGLLPSSPSSFFCSPSSPSSRIGLLPSPSCSFFLLLFSFFSFFSCRPRPVQSLKTFDNATREAQWPVVYRGVRGVRAVRGVQVVRQYNRCGGLIWPVYLGVPRWGRWVRCIPASSRNCSDWGCRLQ